MTKLTTQNELLNHAQELNKHLEESYLGLALALYKIKETEAYKEAGYDDFVAYYKEDLGREKSTISRLLEAGKWMEENKIGLPMTTGVGYRKLALAIKANPNADPKLVLAQAKTLTNAELYATRTENEYGANHTHSPESDKRYARCECGIFFQV